MKILHIAKQFYPCIGGVERYTFELSKRLVERGIFCQVLTINHNLFNKHDLFKPYEIINGVEIFRIPAIGHYKKPIPMVNSLWLWEIFRWADIIHLHDIRFLLESTLFLNLFLRKKAVLSTHGLIFHTPFLNRIKKILWKVYYLPILKNKINCIIADSQQDFEFIKKSNLANVTLIKNPIDYVKYAKVKKRIISGKIVYFGRIDTNKGIDLLLKSLSYLNNKWHLTVIGDGDKSLIAKLQKLAQSENIDDRIEWLGYLPDEDLLEHLSQTHFCVFPSLYEGFGLALLEAMATGTVTLANSIPPFRDIIKDDIDGFISDFSNPQSTADKMASLLSKDISEITELGKKAKSKAKKYDWEMKIGEIIKVYERIIDE